MKKFLQMIVKKGTYPILAITLVSLVGCAAAVKQSSNGPEPIVTNPQKGAGSIAVTLTASSEVKNNDDWKSFFNEWQSAIPDAATDQNATAVVLDDDTSIPSSAKILIRIKVNEFRYVSTTKRYLFGIITGNADMNIEADFLGLPSMQLLGSKNISTTSHTLEGIFSAVTPKQVETVSKLLIQDAQGYTGAN